MLYLFDYYNFDNIKKLENDEFETDLQKLVEEEIYKPKSSLLFEVNSVKISYLFVCLFS